MNLILTTPTAKGGGRLLIPSWGIAHIVLNGDYEMPLELRGSTIDGLTTALAGVDAFGEIEIWFEDARERSH